MKPDKNRREFLQQTTGTLAVAAAATALGGVHAFADDKPAIVRLGIIGCGGIMSHHVKGLVSRTRSGHHRLALRRRSAPDR